MHAKFHRNRFNTFWEKVHWNWEIYKNLFEKNKVLVRVLLMPGRAAHFGAAFKSLGAAAWNRASTGLSLRAQWIFRCQNCNEWINFISSPAPSDEAGGRGDCPLFRPTLRQWWRCLRWRWEVLGPGLQILFFGRFTLPYPLKLFVSLCDEQTCSTQAIQTFDTLIMCFCGWINYSV